MSFPADSIFMDFRGFEAEFLRLAFTTPHELTPSSTAFFIGLPIHQSTSYMNQMVDNGVLELDSDENGRIKYLMPERPKVPIEIGTGFALQLAGSAPEPWAGELGVSCECLALCASPAALPVTYERVGAPRAVAALFLNALVCPGMGSMVGGRNAVGMAQMSLFMVGLPLALVNIGLPLMAASWAWGIVTGAQMVSDSKH